MKTTTKDRIAKICAEAYHGTRPDLEAAIEMALREQDRDTRHACADAVLANDADREMAPAVLQRAHAACMNAQAI